MNLKKILKTIKLQQEKISIILGVLILILAAIFIINYIKNFKNQTENVQVPQNQNQIHIVTKGETLWSISKKYYEKGSDWNKIADTNSISDPTKLEVDQELTIPLSSPEPQAETDISTPSPKPQITETAASTDSSIIGASYTVIKGDTLWDIAIRAYADGYKWVDIARENNLKNPNVIHSGNVFTIPR